MAESNGKTQQFIAAVIVNLICLSCGVCIGWASPLIPRLSSTDPPIGHTPLSKEQIAWISSILPVGGFFTIPFCAVVSERIGRKRFAHLTGLPYIISWLLIIFGNNYAILLIARLFIGVAGAMMFFIVPIYVSEIASEDIRGILGSLLLFSLNIGILLAYVAGAFLSFRMVAILSLTIPVTFLVAFIPIPETPVYLVRRNLELQARKSLMFFRGNNEALVEDELTKLRSLANNSDSPSDKIKLSNLLQDRATRKGLIISFGLLAGQQFSGIFAMMNYAETIFRHAGSSLSAETASIIIAAIQIVGSYASTMLIERAGRRLLTLVSCFGMSVSHAFVALFFYLQQNEYNVSSLSWLPLIALSMFIVTYCLGMGPVPFVVISEVFSLNVSNYASTACFIFYFIVGFVSLRSFDLSMKFLGNDGCFLVLASSCAASFLFLYWLLPETKGREREDIINELAEIDNSYRVKSAVEDKEVESKALMNVVEPV